MARHRKLGKNMSLRKALLRNQATALLQHGRIKTTEARAKEIRRMVEPLIALAVREKDNFETLTIKAKVPRKDENGKRVREVVDGRRVTVFDEVEKQIEKDKPSKLNARRKIMSVLYRPSVVEKKKAKAIDLSEKLFKEIAPKYENRNGGYTRIIKIGERRGDGALEVIIELV